jgi:glycosyltransferase involved in cell wall biosynthesis
VSDAAPDYSIVVPAYNEELLLPATLAALAEAMRATAMTGEIVVCDNNSTDGTAAVARAAGVRVVSESVNHISRARNAGALAARGRYFVFVDADTTVPAAVLAGALEALASGRTVGGGATLTMLPVPSGLGLWLVGVWNRFSKRVRLAAGSFLFVRRDAFEAVGGFSLKVYASEELWLSRSVKRWGAARGLDFVILGDPPVITSARKTEWYSQTTLFLTVLLLFFFPFALRSRTLCWLWYRRPMPRPPEAE